MAGIAVRMREGRFEKSVLDDSQNSFHRAGLRIGKLAAYIKTVKNTILRGGPSGPHEAVRLHS